jgi:diaminopimelate epimerase
MSRNGSWYFIDTGSPHLIVPVDKVENVDVYNEGKKIRYNPRFEVEGVNVNFVEVTNDLVNIRTYERGVENETMACGTGCVAAALWVAMEEKISDGEHTIKLKAPGGLLTVSFRYSSGNGFTHIFLEGPVVKVFEGSIEA